MEFKWAEKEYDLRTFIAKFSSSLPLLVQVTDGYYGLDILGTFGGGDMFWLTHVNQQKRIVVEDAAGLRLAIPEDYRIPFHKVLQCPKPGVDLILDPVPKPLKDVVEESGMSSNELFIKPVDGRTGFALGGETGTYKSVGVLELIDSYDELYLVGHTFFKGDTLKEPIVMHGFVPIKLCIAVGYLSQSQIAFERLVRRLYNKSSKGDNHLVKGGKEIMTYTGDSSINEYSYILPKDYLMPQAMAKGSSRADSSADRRYETITTDSKTTGSYQVLNNSLILPPRNGEKSRSTPQPGEDYRLPKTPKDETSDLKIIQLQYSPDSVTPVKQPHGLLNKIKKKLNPKKSTSEDDGSSTTDATSDVPLSSGHDTVNYREIYAFLHTPSAVPRRTVPPPGQNDSEPTGKDGSDSETYEDVDRIYDALIDTEDSPVTPGKPAAKPTGIKDVNTAMWCKYGLGDKRTPLPVPRPLPPTGGTRPPANEAQSPVGVTQSPAGGVQSLAAGVQSLAAGVQQPAVIKKPQRTEVEEVIYQCAKEIPKQVHFLTKEEVGDALRLLGLSQYKQKFSEQSIDGALLAELDQQILTEEFGFTKFEAVKLLTFVRKGWRPDN